MPKHALKAWVRMIKQGQKTFCEDEDYQHSTIREWLSSVDEETALLETLRLDTSNTPNNNMRILLPTKL